MRLSYAKAREKSGLRVAEAARRIGVTPSAVCQWEKGETVPDSRKLPTIAEVYGVTVDELLRDDNDDGTED